MQASRSIGHIATDFIADWGEFGAHMELVLELDAGGSPTSVADTFNVIDSFEDAVSTTEEKQSIPVEPSKKRKRQTPKQEIDRLRLLEYNLTRRLETLQLESHTRAYSDKRDTFYWKRLAARQHQQLIASEQENQRLKQLVASRIAHAKRLKKSVLRTIHT